MSPVVWFHGLLIFLSHSIGSESLNEPKDELHPIDASQDVPPADYPLFPVINRNKLNLYKDTLGCGHRQISAGEAFTFVSHNYPQHYPKNSDCTWTYMNNNPDVTLRVLCPKVDIQHSQGCKASFLKVTDDKGLKKSVCGKHQKIDVETNGSMMKIAFKSNSGHTKKGFICEISAKERKVVTTPPGRCPACGKIPQTDDVRIVGGEEAPLHHHPYQVGLVHEYDAHVFCGAVLITDKVLLTAAHCAKSIHPEEGEVYAYLGTNKVTGHHQKNQEEQTVNQQKISVSEVIIHNDYHPRMLLHDIALLRLSRPAVLGPMVLPVCLPTKVNDNYEGRMAMASGWGRIEENGAFSETLLQAEMKVVQLKDCIGIYGESKITANHVCAGGDGGVDTCQADSGGPLVVQEDNGSKTLLGITSWGRGCGRPNTPGVYVKVDRYLDWISTHLEKDSCGYLSHLPTPPKSSHYSTDYDCSCGKRNSNTRIVGGSPAEVHEFPWQGSMVQYFSTNPFCGASILSDRWLITAAHCTKDMMSDDQVILGEHNWRKASDSVITLRNNIAKVVTHPDYNKIFLDSDLSLLKLKEPIDFSRYNNEIAPVCLPSQNESFENETGIVTGWGAMEYNGYLSAVLRKVNVPIKSNKPCLAVFPKYMTDNMMCAGYPQGKKDACQGDSGGPMVVKKPDGRYVLAGVVSWGYKCAYPNYPGVYVKVSNYVNWIKSVIKDSKTCN